jgi:hypothetical protein
MTTNERRGEIERLLILLSEAEVALLTRPVIVTGSRQHSHRVTWPASSREDSGLYRAAYTSVGDYRTWISSEAYSAVLFDGSLLQLTYDFLGKDLTGHRLVYFPCPFEMDLGLLREEPLLDVVDLYADSRQDRPRLVSPLRFDFDMRSQREGHPASHLTTISSDCRWAVTAPLSPGHFVRFVFHHFYPALIAALEFLREWPQHTEKRTITELEEQLLHISCGRRASA